MAHARAHVFFKNANADQGEIFKIGSDFYKNEQPTLRKFKLLKENETFNLPLIYVD